MDAIMAEAAGVKQARYRSGLCQLLIEKRFGGPRQDVHPDTSRAGMVATGHDGSRPLSAPGRGPVERGERCWGSLTGPG